MRVGVDVGGTNTDAVLVDAGRVVASVKRLTTADVSEGIREAIAVLLSESGVPATEIDSVMIGTTHFTNAFVQAVGLARVAAIRIGFPAARSIPPFAAWSPMLRDAVRGPIAMIAGGFQFDGRTISPLDEPALRIMARRIADEGITEVAVVSIFAQVNAEHEQSAAAILMDEIPGISVTLSSEVGRTGLIERENAAIMNASLRPLANHVARAFGHALHSLGIDAPFFVSQNDGTLMSAAHMQRYPVLTFAAGPTNSLRGAYFLTGNADALVADIGGTTCDIGVLVGGFPRQSSMHVDIGGIRTNFRMPDILSLGLGGGSRVRSNGDTVTVGPDSVGYRIANEALVFGGNTLTATDLCVAGGYGDIGDRSAVERLDRTMVERGVVEMHRLLADGLDRMKSSRASMPLILVGGGSVLITRALHGISDMIRPPDAGVANAVGAAIGQVSGSVDRIYNCDQAGRDDAIADAKARATEAAISAGADAATIVITEVDDLPLQYLPGGARRIVCRAVGDLANLGSSLRKDAANG
ncbi:hydantoinase/oxoprolinase family protein [Sphingosinicellaceae bacterium]|nr:hydantoinase/oxoprolinase family protein [Sphingosinicellaceae bacterium]